MCGFAVFCSTSEGFIRDSDALIVLKSAAIPHRGSDDRDIRSDWSEGIGFGFRRLSFVEFSQVRNQPMLSSGGRFVIMFNGEVYNHMDLKVDLSPW